MSTLPAPVKIRLRSLAPAAGLFWLRRGFRTFFRRPGGFMGLFAFVLLLVVVSMMLPAALRLAAIVLMPLMSLGFMLATEDVLNDLPLRPSVFWAPLTAGRAQLRALLTIGLVYVAASLLIVFFGDAIDGGEASRWMEQVMTPRADGQMPEIPLLSGVGTAVLLLKTFGMALVSVPLWHAPALVHWGRQGAAQAMFSSIVAIWRTRAAFLVYILGWFVVLFLFTLAISVFAAIFGAAPLALVALTPVSWALSAVFYTSIWFCFVDTFEITPTVAYRTVLADADTPAP
jgi:hypothetical protein